MRNTLAETKRIHRMNGFKLKVLLKVRSRAEARMARTDPEFRQTLAAILKRGPNGKKQLLSFHSHL